MQNISVIRHQHYVTVLFENSTITNDMITSVVPNFTGFPVAFTSVSSTIEDTEMKVKC